MQTSNPLINQFIINTVLIDPIQDILSKIKEGSFRDCDIKWLDSKFEAFIKFAAETLGITGIMPSEVLASKSFKHLNNYSKDVYSKRFQTLLDYFKSL